MSLRTVKRQRDRGIGEKHLLSSVLGLFLIMSLSSCVPGTQEAAPTSTSQPLLGTTVLTMRYGLPPIEIATSSGEKIWGIGGGPLSNEAVENLNQLADSGFKINRTLLWWNYLPGYNRLDAYYDEAIRQRLEMILDFQFYGAEPGEYYGQPSGEEQPWSGLDAQKLWAVTLGDEGPGGFAGSQFYGTLSEDIARYADIYNAETGHTLKPLDQMNLEEYYAFNEWLNEKTVWIFNYLYDYVKTKWPHLQVFQYIMMEGVWGQPYDIGAPYELKGDGFIMDCYYAKDNPWLLYETIRRYKTILPDQPFHIVLWGVIWDFSQQENGTLVTYQEGSFEQFQREAWIAYLSGADGIGWFDWGPQGPGSQDWRPGWERSDPLGQQVFTYTGLLSRQIAQLPVLESQPVILAIDAGGSTPPVYSEAGFFTEYDLVSERAFAVAALDLSQYRLIVVPAGRYRDETVARLNAYVEGGGNVIFLGGAGSQRNLYDTGIRQILFPFEQGASEVLTTGQIDIEISQPNMLDLSLIYNSQYYETFSLVMDDPDENFHPIGQFTMTNPDGSSNPVPGYPLFLYHDDSQPNSGWILYWGASRSWQSADYDPEDKSDLYGLHSAILQAFAEFVGISDAVASTETQEMIITQGMLENGMLLAGIGNLQPQERSLTYHLDLNRFDLPEGEYWVYSLDEGASLGSYSTTVTRLEIPLTVAASGTRLLIVSSQPFDPGFSVDIFPDMP